MFVNIIANVIISLSTWLRIHWQKECTEYDTRCSWWWGFNFRDLGSVEYAFIAINRRSTKSRSGSICYCSIQGWNWFFKNYSYSIGMYHNDPTSTFVPQRARTVDACIAMSYVVVGPCCNLAVGKFVEIPKRCLSSLTRKFIRYCTL